MVFCVLIEIYSTKGKPPQETKVKHDKYFGEATFFLRIVCRWFQNFEVAAWAQVTPNHLLKLLWSLGDWITC